MRRHPRAALAGITVTLAIPPMFNATRPRRSGPGTASNQRTEPAARLGRPPPYPRDENRQSWSRRSVPQSRWVHQFAASMPSCAPTEISPRRPLVENRLPVRTDQRNRASGTRQLRASGDARPARILRQAKNSSWLISAVVVGRAIGQPQNRFADIDGEARRDNALRVSPKTRRRPGNRASATSIPSAEVPDIIPSTRIRLV